MFTTPGVIIEERDIKGANNIQHRITIFTTQKPKKFIRRIGFKNKETYTLKKRYEGILNRTQYTLSNSFHTNGGLSYDVFIENGERSVMYV